MISYTFGKSNLKKRRNGYLSWYNHLPFELTECDGSRGFLLLFPTSKIDTPPDFIVLGCLLAAGFGEHAALWGPACQEQRVTPAQAIPLPTGSDHSEQGCLLVTGSFVTDMAKWQMMSKVHPCISNRNKRRWSQRWGWKWDCNRGPSMDASSRASLEEKAGH